MNRGEAKQKFLHKAEVSVLRTLRKVPSARFTDLMRPTGLTSDMFKFYLRDLKKSGWIQKLSDGQYELTSSGKELANTVDEPKQTVRKQPKLSMLLVLARNGPRGTEYLFQQRLRHPYFGLRGLLSGPVRWGESIEQAALRELQKQTGLTGQCRVRSFIRVMDVDPENPLLEDKLFAVVEVANIAGSLSNAWSGGHNSWMTIAELRRHSRAFPLTEQTLAVLQRGVPYASLTAEYPSAQY